MTIQIPFHRSTLTGKEQVYLTELLGSGRLAAEGTFTKRCAEFLQTRFGVSRVLMTPSCSSALELAVELAGVRAGDEVILPSFTFTSTGNAVARFGAQPVFVEIEPTTMNIDAAAVERAITSKTKAIIVVHYAGVSCDMDRLSQIARARNICLIEDAAQGVGATYRGRALGSLGAIGAYSFHDTKNIACSEGGALCLNDPELIEQAEIIREKGTNRSKFFRGLVDKYTWVSVGASHVPSELSMAFLLAQLEALEQITAARARVDAFYRTGFQGLERAGKLHIGAIPDYAGSNYHIFYVTVESTELRDKLLDHMKRCGVGTTFHYIPLHSSPMGAKLGCDRSHLPITEAKSSQLLRLPIYPSLTEPELDQVVTAVKRFF